jgi:hypothetical protein
MKMTIDQTVAAVKNAPSSIFTKDDVMNLLANLEAPKGGGLDEDQIDRLVRVVVDQVKSNVEDLQTEDVCDIDSAEFELNGNEISLCSIDIYTRGIRDAVVESIGEEIEAFFENLKEDGDEQETLEIPGS